ncbi:MAG: DivIVA domain-containing protein [Actinomycetales bacterium]|nr:DivIVA domain-containing protein [Actinomycetales bacterium]
MAESARESRGVESGVGVAPVLTPTEIRNAAFGTTRLRTGYDMDEVDAFLDMIEERLAVLLAELQRAQEGEAQYRAQYEQLRSRVGSAAPTTIVRAESPQASQSPQELSQALAQALLVRQALIAQLREHIGQVESQIRSVQASVDTAATAGVLAAAQSEPSPAQPVSAQGAAAPDVDPDQGQDSTERATGPIAGVPRDGAPRARGPVPPDATQEIPTQPRYPGT